MGLIYVSLVVNNYIFHSRTIDRSNFKSIVHIAAIPKSESLNVHLMAITSSGKIVPQSLLY